MSWALPKEKEWSQSENDIWNTDNVPMLTKRSV